MIASFKLRLGWLFYYRSWQIYKGNIVKTSSRVTVTPRAEVFFKLLFSIHWRQRMCQNAEGVFRLQKKLFSRKVYLAQTKVLQSNHVQYFCFWWQSASYAIKSISNDGWALKNLKILPLVLSNKIEDKSIIKVVSTKGETCVFYQWLNNFKNKTLCV